MTVYGKCDGTPGLVQHQSQEVTMQVVAALTFLADQIPQAYFTEELHGASIGKVHFRPSTYSDLSSVAFQHFILVC
jgi:hypothetical protein